MSVPYQFILFSSGLKSSLLYSQSFRKQGRFRWMNTATESETQVSILVVINFNLNFFRNNGSIFFSVMQKQSGNLVRKPSGGERAGFLEEESEPRTKCIFLAVENTRAAEAVCLTSKKVILEIGMHTAITVLNFLLVARVPAHSVSRFSALAALLRIHLRV